MAAKRRNLFLYLTLVCFLGLIAIFIVDGYMGVYDTVYITAGEREQKIESDVWRRGDKFWSSGVNRGKRRSSAMKWTIASFPAIRLMLRCQCGGCRKKCLMLSHNRWSSLPLTKDNWSGHWTQPRFSPAMRFQNKAMSTR